MNVDQRRARALVQPHVSKGDAAFKPEALNRHRRQFRRNCQIDEQGEAFAATQGPVKMHDGTFETGEGRDNAKPFEVAVMIATDNDRLARARVFLIPSLAILELNVTREILTR